MKKLLSVLTLSTLLIACSEPPSTIIGQEKDTYGCLASAGQSYSFLKKECVQVFNIADITLKDPQNDSLAVYIIFSEDRTQAEVFAADLPENTILEAVKGGYLSKDSKIRLLKTDNHWKIRK